MSRYTFPDGKSAKEKTKAGQAMFSQPVTHASENIGGAAMESVMVELKTKPAEADPHACKVEVDNEYVRVSRVRLPPHGKLAMHSHPSNVVVYLSDGHSKATMPDGKSEESTLAPGTVKFNRPIEHSNENLGDNLPKPSLSS